MLNEVALPRSCSARVCHELPHAVKLLVARKDEKSLPGLAPFLVLLFDLVDELADEVEYAVARPSLFPEICSGVAFLRRRHRWIARTTEASLVERQEPGSRTGEVGRYIHEVRVDCEVCEAAPVGEEGFARIAVGLVLPHCVLNVLPGERVLQFRGEDRYPVQEQHQIQA